LIDIKCRAADSLPLDAIEDFQGNLKKRGKKEIDAIITSIEKYGFSFPFFVWNGDGHNRCLDGHGRIQALAEMRKRGIDLPLFPVAYIDAKDEAEAKQKLLRLNSQYGAMSIDSVLEFTDGMEVEWGELALPDGGNMSIIGLDAEALMPDLPTGDKEPFQQMTFTLADEQAESVKQAVETAKGQGAGDSDVNSNSNGNALAFICEDYLGRN
jgi:ParB family chromosome partitioning protein